VLREKEDAEIRAYVVHTLGVLGEKAVVSELLTMLKDKQEDSFVRQSAAEALGKLGEKTAAPDLLTVLKDRRVNSLVLRSVVGALIKLGQRETVLPYVDLLAKYNLLPGKLIWNVASLRQLLSLLKQRHVPSDVYEQFWAVSKREKVRILMFKWKFVRFVRVVEI